jgi:hypothetical protein
MRGRDVNRGAPAARAIARVVRPSWERRLLPAAALLVFSIPLGPGVQRRALSPDGRGVFLVASALTTGNDRRGWNTRALGIASRMLVPVVYGSINP